MKKITLFIALFAFSFGFAQNGGDSCGAAVPAAVGPYTATLITPGINGGEGGGAGAQSSAWFSYTPGADGTIDVASVCAGVDTRLHIGSGTCGTLAFSTNDDCDYPAGEYGSTISDYPVLMGVTYYIEWDDRWSGAAFDWTLTYNAPPPCSEPTNVVADLLLDTSLDFSWDAAAFGTVTGYDWEVVPDGNLQGVGVVDSGSTAGLSASATGLTAATAYDIYIRTDCGNPPVSTYLGPLSFTTLAGPPPANDLCSGAITVVQETSIIDAASATAIPGTVLNAANTTVAAESCNGFTGTAGNDVWYQFTALTATVNITFELDYDSVATLYSSDGTCAGLVFDSCADDNITGPADEQISATGLSIGQVYFCRVYPYGGAPVNPAFNLKVWSSETLGVDQFENENAFSYYPNPVKNTLSLNAQNNIQNVSVYNMLGQEVLRTAPNSVDSEVSMTSLQSGAYFVKVTINEVTETIRIIKQ